MTSAPTTLRDRFNLSRLAIHYSWLTILLWIGITVAGVWAYGSLKYALFPDITFPIVIVNATAPLETSLETESQLAAPIEQNLRSLDRLNDIRSSIYAGRTVTSLRFKVGTDLAASTQSVETALQTIPWPADTDYNVTPLNLNEAVAISYALTSDSLDLEALTEQAEADILPRLRSLNGILRVDLLGTGLQATPPPDLADADFQDSPTLVRFNQTNALAIQVIKQGDANTLDVVSLVEAEVSRIAAEQIDLDMTLAATQANYIREATQSTIEALFMAIVLAVLVIFVFLRNWQATLITALAIPLSLLGTFVVMASYQFNLETITLLALALVIGIIVDDAIVEVENIARHLEEGKSPREAALAATQEIGLTVSASTLTIVAVFLPVALIQGTVGQFFKPFGLTVSAAVLISLLIARTLSPVLAVYWMRAKVKPSKSNHPESTITPLSTTPDTLEPNTLEPNDRITQLYCQLLTWSLQHRTIVIGLAIVSFAAGLLLIPLIPKGFIPKLDRGEFNVNYLAPLPDIPQPPEGSPLATSETLSLQNDASVASDTPLNLTELDRPDPRSLVLDSTRAVAEDIEPVVADVPGVQTILTTIGLRGQPNRGRLYVTLDPNRELTTADIQEQIRAQLPTLEGTTVSVEDIQFVEIADSKPFQIALLGNDLTEIREAAQQLAEGIQELPGFVDVEVSGEESSGALIERLNGERVVYLSANLTERLGVGDATDQAVNLSQAILPPTVTLALEGDSKLSSNVFGSFTTTLALSLLCMLGFLILPFGRLLEPLVVGLSVPLSMIGAMLALLITQSDFGMISLIGLLFLLGLLDKNAILILDYANQQRRLGLPRTEALIKTGRVRLRPILMTTFSTILGMTPLALGFGAGAELRQPMAVAIIGGLITSSLLSLVVVPVLYALIEDWWTGLRKVAQR